MSTTASPARAGGGPGDPTQPSRHVNRFLQEHGPHQSGKTRAISASPMKLSAVSHTSLEHLIFSAMRHLPVPILVLNNTKTVVYANEAIGTLLGIPRHSRDDNFEDFSDVQMRLRGQTLCQVGVDMLRDGRLIWVSWDAFLDSVASELRVHSGRKGGVRGAAQTPVSPTSPSGSDYSDSHGGDAPTLASLPTQDIAVDVVICGSDLGKMSEDPAEAVGAFERQIHATMIVTAWEFADKQTYFTLTFTQSEPASASLDSMGRRTSSVDAVDATGRDTPSDPTHPPSRSDSQGSVASTSDGAAVPSTHFPPPGPPSKSVEKAPLSHLQKLTKMKDVVLNSMDVPIFVMWKDGSAVFPNKASRNLCRVQSDFDHKLRGRASLLNWDAYTEDFSRKLSIDELPISVLLRNEQPFEGMRMGLFDKSGRRLICDARGELLRDKTTGEVFAGLISLADVTRFAEELTEIKQHGEQRFKQICNTMPQLVWTTDSEANFDFFNIRWYEYTGLSFDRTIGDNWTSVLHPDDRVAVLDKWKHCIKTGEDYAVDYRIRSKHGEYRWFLARANPLRDRETGEILKWFGELNAPFFPSLGLYHLSESGSVFIYPGTRLLTGISRHVHRCQRDHGSQLRGQADATAAINNDHPLPGYTVHCRHKQKDIDARRGSRTRCHGSRKRRL
ncbi:PAS domain-containing protein [Candidatus Bathyarchaeota archaeon]|nr:PAS domain-containing protein [Candidatus Bathyarchaeota archaeon]